MTWLLSVAYQLDCLLAAILTGVRCKTLSAWTGQCRAGHFGRFWRVAIIPAYLVINTLAIAFTGSWGHCEYAAVPYTDTLNKD